MFAYCNLNSTTQLSFDLLIPDTRFPRYFDITVCYVGTTYLYTPYELIWFLWCASMHSYLASRNMD